MMREENIPLLLLLLIILIGYSHSLIAKPFAISRGVSGKTAQGDSYSPQATPDGKWIVFASKAEDLVNEDNNRRSDIFLYNTNTQKLELISQGFDGNSSNGDSNSPSISDDGRYVTFRSKASNLVEGNIYLQWFNIDPFENSYDNPNQTFLYDRDTKTTKRISSILKNIKWLDQGDKSPQISGDGRYITYIQEVSRFQDIIIQYDRETEAQSQIELSHCRSEGKIFALNTSNDGRFITYAHGSNEWSGINDAISADVCLYDRNRQYSRSIYQQKNREIFDPFRYFSNPDISDNGRYIVFESYKTEGSWGTDSLISKIYLDTVFLYDTTFAGLNTLYQDLGKHDWYTHDSLGSGVSQIDGSQSLAPNISNDGRFVVFTGSQPVDIGDQNQTGDAFIYDIRNRTFKRLTYSIEGYAPNHQTQSIWMGGMDNQVLIVSEASNLTIDDDNHGIDIFRLKTDSFNTQPLISKPQINYGESLDIYFPLGTDPNGYQFGIQMPNQDTFLIQPSSDQSLSIIPSSSNHLPDILKPFFDPLSIEELSIDNLYPTGTYTLFSVPKSRKSYQPETILETDSVLKTQFQINPLPFKELESDNIYGECMGTLSNSGEFTIFGSQKSLVEEDTNNAYDYYICDVKSGKIKRITVNPQGQQFQSDSYRFSISSNSRWVAFTAYHQPGSDEKLYRYEVATHRTQHILPETNLGDINDIKISGNGKSIIFSSQKDNIVNGIEPELYGLFLWEEQSEQVKFIADKITGNSVIDQQGSAIIFSSSQLNLLNYVENKEVIKTSKQGTTGLYIYDNNTSKYTAIPQKLDNVTNTEEVPYLTQNHGATYPQISADGQVISYQIPTRSYSLHSKNYSYLAVYDRKTARNKLLTAGDKKQFILGYFSNESLSETGQFIAFVSSQAFPLENYLLPAKTGFYYYRYDRLNQSLSLLQDQLGFEKYYFSPDGYHYRINNRQYNLLDRPYINKSTFKIGENLQISLPEKVEGYSQYFGLEYPNGQIQIYQTENLNHPLNSENFLPYQGRRNVIDTQITIDDWPEGEYRAYLLYLPSEFSTTDFQFHINSGNGQLGTSLFSIIYQRN